MSSMGSSKKYGYNPNPRLSANQLAEYLNASSTRRKSIIRDAKFPKGVIVARYDGARDAITAFLTDPTRSMTEPTAAIEAMKAKGGAVGAKPWVQDDCKASVEAVNALLKAQNKLGLNKMNIRPILSKQPKLVMEGVEVSITLNATTHRVDKDKQDRVGGLLLLFSKSEPSASKRDERCRVSSVLAAEFADQYLKGLGAMDPKLCVTIDVFGGRIIAAPPSYKKRLTDMIAACEEVALRWPTVEVPADYDGPAF